VTLTFYPLTPKSIGVFYPIWTIILWSLNIVGQMELKLCFGNQIANRWTDFRTDGRRDVPTIGVYVLLLWSLCGIFPHKPVKLTHKTVGLWDFILFLTKIMDGMKLIDHRMFARTDRQTDARGYNIICPFGHIKMCKIRLYWMLQLKIPYACCANYLKQRNSKVSENYLRKVIFHFALSYLMSLKLLMYAICITLR
jgi:hypothetical protein